MVRPWPSSSRRSLLRTSVFSVEAHVARSPRTGQEHEFVVMDAPDWVNVIALADAEHLLMIRQYRHGSEQITLEIPGGVIDPTDGSPVAAARRELWEETGYRAKCIQYLGSVDPNPALQSNRCHTCLATDLGGDGRQELDGAEDIEVIKQSIVQIPDLIRQGVIRHALVVVGLCWYLGLGDGSARLAR